MTQPQTSPLIDRLRLDGKHAVVTGAASGLGRAITTALAEFGAEVTMVDIDKAGLHDVAEELSAGGGRVHVCPCDVSDVGALEAAIADAADARSGLDIAFANAGIAGGASIRDATGTITGFDWSVFQRTLDINLTGTMATVRAAAAVMRPRGTGSIVITVSTAGLRADDMVGYGYATAKGALANLVRQAAVDLAPDGIRVNGIAPGPFHTNIGGAGPRDPEIDAAWARTVLLGRMADPEELQGLAVLLASDASSFMTASTYAVDGGAMAGAFGSG